MSKMEQVGDMKHWLRSSVIIGDLLIWVSAVVFYARANFGLGKPEKATQTIVSRVSLRNSGQTDSSIFFA